MNNKMFRKISRFSPLYLFLRECFRFSFTFIYYRRFYTRTLTKSGKYVKGAPELPKKGVPMVIVSNHQNGLTDALLILFALPRRFVPVYMARADVFKKKWIANILYFFRLMPIYRMRDGKEQLSENEHIFATAARVIRKGLPICLFPEGTHQEGHWLGMVKKGFAKIAFEAAERMNFPPDMTVVPCGNHYNGYHGYRNEVLFTFGAPIMLADYYDRYRENPPKACLQLAHDVEIRINELVLNIDIPREYYEAIDFARSAERGKKPRASLPEQLQKDRTFIERIRSMSHDNLKAYSEKMLTRKNNIRKSITLRKTLKAILLFPLAIVGFLLHAIPTLTGEAVAKKLSASNKMLRSGIEYILCELILTTLFYIIYTILFFTLVPSLIPPLASHIGLSYLAFATLLFISKIAWLELRPR